MAWGRAENGHAGARARAAAMPVVLRMDDQQPAKGRWHQRMLSAISRRMGKGTELVKNYDACELVYMNIGNIHALRDAFEDVVKLCQPWALQDHTTWLQRLVHRRDELIEDPSADAELATLRSMPRLLVRGSTAPPVTPGDGDSAY